MAINLSKNKDKHLIYNSKEKRRIKLFIYMTTFMIIATTAAIVLAFLLLPATKGNFALISILSMVGYLGAFFYYDLYLAEKGRRRF